MQLHRLTLRGVGPFRAEHTVDLDRLGASGLFLLEGPTGSGKSTVIDAIVFALYGTVASGSLVETARMASDHVRGATAAQAPFVELEFSTGSGRYVINRTPRHVRAKLRGGGERTVEASALLSRVVSPGAAPEVVVDGMQEVGAEIVRVVGLNRAQFVQTVVLPQGRFATFLHSDAEARRDVLQTIFGTDLYEAVQRELVARRAVARARRDQSAAALRETVAALVGAVEPTTDIAARLLNPLSEADRDDALAMLLTSVAEEEKLAAEDHRLAEADHVAATEELTRRQRHAELVRRRRGLESRRARIALQAPEIDALRRRLHDAARAARVVDAVAAVTSAQADTTATHNAFRDACRPLPVALGPLPPEPAAALVLLDRAAAAAHDEAASLSAAVEKERALPARRERLAQQRAVAVEAARAEAALVAEQADLPSLQDRARADLEAAVRLAATEPALTLEASLHMSVQEACRAVQERLDPLAAARTELAVAAAEARDAVDNLHAVERARIDGIAGELAAGLQPGVGCPVCGSPEHPAPAALAAGHADEAAVTAAAERRDSTAEALKGAAARHAAALSTVVAAAAAAGLPHGALERAGELAALASAAVEAQLAARVAADAVRARLAEAESAARAVPALREAELALRTRGARLDVDVREAIARANTAAAEVEALARDLATCEDTVAAAAAGFPSVAVRHRTLTSDAAALADAVLAARAAVAAAEVLRRANDGCAAALAREGFASADEARAAVCDPAVVASLTARVSEHEAEVAAVVDGLADPALLAVDPDAPVDLAAAEATAAAAKERADTALIMWRHCQRRLGTAEERAGELHRARRTCDEVHAATAAAIRLADLANATSAADNRLKLELSAFVLRRRFAEVVAAANRRLAEMSDGRYTLVPDDTSVGGKRSGLGLVVLDQYTGRTRAPSTLSGGETFYCSLSLALGLADMVRAEAGGVDLGTLFVDEGFGSLDPDTLASVLDVLAGLRTGGRVVGVVSHVRELKELIPDRLSVRPAGDGSSTWRLVAGPD